MLEKTDILMSNSISFNFNYQVRTHTPSTKREASENTFGFWQVKSSHQMLSYNFCDSNTSHRCSAILLPRNISTTKALSVDKPTKSQLSHWNSQPSSTREALLYWFRLRLFYWFRLKQIINRAAQDLGCFSGFDQQHKPGHQLLAFGHWSFPNNTCILYHFLSAFPKCCFPVMC